MSESKTAAVAASPLTIWHCEVSQMDQPLESLTVGDRFRLSCEGPEITPLGPQASIEFVEKDDAYKLALLKIETSEKNKFVGQLTAYKPDKMEKKEFNIRDGSSGFHADGIDLKITSVINPQQPPGGPFGPWGPFELSYPLWLWFTFGFALIIMVTAIWLFLRRLSRAAQLRAEMTSNQLPLRPFYQHSPPLNAAITLIPVTALSPLNQLTKDLRKLAKYFGAVRGTLAGEISPAQMGQALEEIFRLFLVRQFKVPAHAWSPSKVLRAIRRRQPKIWRDEGPRMERLFSELKRLREGASALSSQEYEQISEMMQTLAARVMR